MKSKYRDKIQIKTMKKKFKNYYNNNIFIKDYLLKILY